MGHVTRHVLHRCFNMPHISLRARAAEATTVKKMGMLEQARRGRCVDGERRVMMDTYSFRRIAVLGISKALQAIPLCVSSERPEAPVHLGRNDKGSEGMIVSELFQH